MNQSNVFFGFSRYFSCSWGLHTNDLYDRGLPFIDSSPESPLPALCFHLGIESSLQPSTKVNKSFSPFTYPSVMSLECVVGSVLGTPTLGFPSR